MMENCVFTSYFVLPACNAEKASILKKKVLAFLNGVCIMEFVNRRKEFYNEQRRISTRNF